MNNDIGTSVSKEKKRWFAIYTRSRTEKRVHDRLKELGIESFLPLQKTLRQWSDRKKWVQEPLFKSYVFVHVNAPEHFIVIKVEGVVKFVSFESKAIPIPDVQIENLKLLLKNEIKIEVSTLDLKVGQKVQVCDGPLKGLKGELIKLGSKKRFVVRIEHISQNLLVNIPVNYLKKEN